MKRLDLIQIVFVALATGATAGCVVEDDHRHREHEEHHEEVRHERETRVCPHCGVRIDIDAKVCGSCGVSVR